MTLTHRYRKRPNFVDAVQVSAENLEEVAKWVGGRAFESGKASDPTDVAVGVYVPTMEGPVAVSLGAYIFRDPRDGTFEIRHAAEFERLYERVGLRGEPVPPYTN